MISIEKAVIPVAGLGTRLRTLSRGEPKEMLPIGGRPMIYYAVLEAALSGLKHLYMVINERKTSLRRYLESERLKTDLKSHPKANRIAIPRIIFIDQPVPLGSGEAIYRTKEMIDGEPFALLMPDFLLYGPSPALPQMLPLFEQFGQDIVGVLILGAREAEGFGNVGIFQPTPLEKDLVKVHGISKKIKAPLRLQKGKTIHKAVGRAIFGAHFFSLLERVRPLKGEWDDAPAFRALCKEREVMGRILEGTGFDVGNPVGYLAATEKFESF